MDNAYPINPKETLGLSVIYSVPTWRPVEGPLSSLIPHPPTDRPTDLPTYLPTYLRSVPLYIINNGAPVSDSGREN